MAFIRHRLELPRELSSGSRDDILLALGLTLVTLADGGLDAGEEALLDGLRQALPDWSEFLRSTAFADAVEAQLHDSLARYREAIGEDADLDPAAFALFAVDDLVELEDETTRKRCFLLGVDIALAAGGITDEEDAVLEKMARVFDLDAATIEQVIGAMRLKYGCL